MEELLTSMIPIHYILLAMFILFAIAIEVCLFIVILKDIIKYW